MTKETYREFKFEKEIEIAKKIDKLYKNGNIQRIYPLNNVDSDIRVYKTEGFTIGTAVNEEKDILEISKYNSLEKMNDKLSELEKLIGIKLTEE